MKIYYKNKLVPIIDPLDMKDTHDILKQNTVPEDCQLESNQSYANKI